MKRTLFHLTIATLLVSSSGVAWAADPNDTNQSQEYPATNTGRNARDRDDRTLTPTDQSESAADRKLSAEIRKAVVDDDSLSVTAHNIKIITVNGVVTLRGPVESQRERNAIVAKAKRVSGVKKVDNKLEIAAKESAPGSAKD
jgi:osmotically-inducible protein OsmY